jgi:hypothetical protein
MKRSYDETVDEYKFFVVDLDDPILIHKNEEIIQRSATIRKMTHPVIHLPFTSDVVQGLRKWIDKGKFDCDRDMQMKMEQLIMILNLQWC